MIEKFDSVIYLTGFLENMDHQDSMTDSNPDPKPISMQYIFKTWWPLAASWVLMGLELPMISAVIARLENPEINLAAYGGIVFPLALLIEAPIIMLLAASTALSKDIPSYSLVRRFMMVTSASLTALHLLVVFTPLYYFVVVDLMGAPPEIVEPARTGLIIMIPWTWSIAYRRFNQGVLIRFGHSTAITIGTIIRFSMDALVLGIGYLAGSIPGIVVATSAVAAGVISEAIYSGFVVSPVVKNELPLAKPVIPALNWSAFFRFYIPLFMTSLLYLIGQPLVSAAINRMPENIPSLAVWPVLGGFLFALRSLGVAYNEVVVAILDQPRSYYNLNRFTNILAIVTTALLVIVAATPFSSLWFEKVSALSPELSYLAKSAIWLAIPLPALSVYQSWFQGAIVYGRQTIHITISVCIYLVSIALVLGIGISSGAVAGIYAGIAALTLGFLAQTAWMWIGSRATMKKIKDRDCGEIPFAPVGIGIN